MNLWCDEQLVVTVEGPPGRREIFIPKPYARIGWHPDSEIVLQGAHVAKRALYLHATVEGVFALNLDREEAPLDQQGRWLGAQDVLAVGEYRLSVRRAAGAAETAAASDLVRWGSASPPLPVVRIFCGPLLKDKRRFRARLNILGRRPQCALQLRGQRVSSFHAVLFWDQRRLWCIDLLSGNGTFLNGKPIECAELHLGDRLEIGEFSLVYYRWSPRRSMTPGWQPSAVEPSPHDSDAAEAQDLIACGAEGSPAPPLLSPAAPPLYAELAAEIQRLSQERHDLQQHWQQVVQQLGCQLEALRTETIQLRQEREALEAQRLRWQQQRDELTRVLDQRTAELHRLRSELAAARRFQGPPAVLPPSLAAGGTPPDDVPPTAAARLPEEPGLEAAPRSGDSPAEPSESLAAAAPHDATAGGLALMTLRETATAPLALPLGPGPGEGRPETATRRRSGPRELTGLISARLIDLEQARRRKLAIVWTAAGLVAAAVGMLAWGLWRWRS